MINTARIALIAQDGSHLDTFYKALQELDLKIKPTAEQAHQLQVDGDLVVDFDTQIDLLSLDDSKLSSLIADYELEDVLGVVVLLDNASAENLALVPPLWGVLRIGEPHLATIVVVPDDSDDDAPHRQDEVRLDLDLMMDEDPLFFYTTLDAETCRELLVALLDEAVRLRDEYAIEANNILDILLDDE